MYAALSQSVLPHLIPPKSKILIAVSGGPDSVALAHVLWRFATNNKDRGIELVISHVNHGVRRESEEEEVMVKGLAEEWGLPCVVHRFDAKHYAEETGKSFQEAARTWRYARWEEDMQQWGCSLMATAHHLGDQAETVLYRLIRGSGTAGLAGIYPKQGQIIRPFLTINKEAILDYCHKHQLKYAIDLSNTEPVYVRNKIRLELIPELETHYNPRIIETLGRTAEILRWDEEFLNKVTETSWPRYVRRIEEFEVALDREIFGEPKAILTRLLRKAIYLVTKEPRGIGFAFIQGIIEAQDKKEWVQDFPGLKVIIEEDLIVFCNSRHILPRVNKSFTPKTVPLNAWVEIPELNLEVGMFEREVEGKWATEVSRDYIEALSEPIVCRPRGEGDRMWIRGVGHKALKKIFQDHQIPGNARSFIPLIATAKNILWIPGVKRSDEGRIIVDNPKFYLVMRQIEG